MSYLDARKDLVFNGIYSLYLGPNSSKSDVLFLEKETLMILFNSITHGVPNQGLNVDQELVMTAIKCFKCSMELNLILLKS